MSRSTPIALVQALSTLLVNLFLKVSVFESMCGALTHPFFSLVTDYAAFRLMSNGFY